MIFFFFTSYNEIKHNTLGDMYAFEHYENAIMSMVYIGLVSTFSSLFNSVITVEFVLLTT